MRNRVKSFSLVGLLFSGLFFLSGSAFAADGKQTFLDLKCNKCHTVKSAGIAQLAKQPAEPGEEEDEDEDEDDTATEPSDLSKLDDQIMKAGEGAGAHLKKWLRKEVQHKNKSGKLVRHKKLFKGSEAELTALTDFLLK